MAASCASCACPAEASATGRSRGQFLKQVCQDHPSVGQEELSRSLLDLASATAMAFPIPRLALVTRETVQSTAPNGRDCLGAAFQAAARRRVDSQRRARYTGERQSKARNSQGPFSTHGKGMES